MRENTSILFYEQQKFRKTWLLMLIVACMMSPIVLLFILPADKDISNVERLLMTLVVLLIEVPLFILFYNAKFEIIVTHEGLGYRWLPLQKKYRMLYKDELQQIQTRKGPILNYGIHWTPGYGWVHNAEDGRGLQIKLSSGKRIFVGSAKVDELKSVLEKLLNKPIVDFRNEF